MKIGVITDVHGNLAAAKAAVVEMKKAGCDKIISLGDVLAIGPYPKKTLAYLISEQVILLKGNHEMYYLMDEKTLRAHAQYPGELVHQLWVRATMGSDYYEYIKAMPRELTLNIEGKTLYFTHYAMADDWFKAFVDEPDAEALYTLFNQEADYIFYGHHHPKHQCFDAKRNIHYINPGALGCGGDNQAAYAVVILEDEKVTVAYGSATYDRASTLKAFETEEVPSADFIKEHFYKEKL